MLHSVFHTLKKVTDGMKKRGNNNLKAMDLTLNQCAVLGYLSSREAYTAPIKSIEKDFEVSQATMQGTISRLVKKGLIDLSNDATDKRIKNATLTALGHEVWHKADEHRKKVEEQVFADLTPDDIEMLQALLIKIYNRLE